MLEHLRIYLTIYGTNHYINRNGEYIQRVGVRTHGGPKPTSKCCVSLSWMVIQGEHTGVYPNSGKRRPYVQWGEMFVFPCTEVLV
jgi:hypothetical protein